jgi:hypothetical protein
MKTKVLILLLISVFSISNCNSQDKSRKEKRAELRLEKKTLVESMIASREFIFIGRNAMPTGMSSVNLSLNSNFMKFLPDLIESEMPFYGNAYSAIGYGGDTGVKFKGKPEVYNIKKDSEGYQIDAEIKTPNDKFTVSLSVSPEGSASLRILSIRRSSISYTGEIVPIEK